MSHLNTLVLHRLRYGELSGAEAFSTQQLVVEGDLGAAAGLAQAGLL